ncbi:hypothetical protein LLY42_14070 [Pseudomonas frederiksbergensis]|nr:hypothetical protein LLY42_14070 [Pseudomonas frederiksbergensis]
MLFIDEQADLARGGLESGAGLSQIGTFVALLKLPGSQPSAAPAPIPVGVAEGSGLLIFNHPANGKNRNIAATIASGASS